MLDLYVTLGQSNVGRDTRTGRETDTKEIETADRDRAAYRHDLTSLPLS